MKKVSRPKISLKITQHVKKLFSELREWLTWRDFVIRDFLRGFWLSPKVSTRDPIISLRALDKGQIMVEG